MKNFEKTDEIDVLKELSSLDIADSNKLHNCALRLRGLAAKFISTIDEPLGTFDYARSHFKEFGKLLLDNEADVDLNFNELVTDKALRALVLSLNDPRKILYIGSKLIEQNFCYIYRLKDFEKNLISTSLCQSNLNLFTQTKSKF